MVVRFYNLRSEEARKGELKFGKASLDYRVSSRAIWVIEGDAVLNTPTIVKE